MKSNVYVYIGRFQLPHLGHEAVIENAINNVNEVIILVGSSNVEKSDKNPFSYEERRTMIKDIVNVILRKVKNSRTAVYCIPLPDLDTDDKWKNKIYELLEDCKNENITLTGSRKPGDESTYYLDMFPDWKQDFIAPFEYKGEVVSSTDLRREWREGRIIPGEKISDSVYKNLVGKIF